MRNWDYPENAYERTSMMFFSPIARPMQPEAA
jgi:hypothetical protein